MVFTLFVFGHLSLPLCKKSNDNSELLIFMHLQKDIGFLKISSKQAPATAQDTKFTSHYLIDLCAISMEHRNQKHGSNMIAMFLETLPDNTEVLVYCTKYAQAMQHILRRLKFKIDKSGSHHPEVFRLQK
jgi:hypothetical protein